MKAFERDADWGLPVLTWVSVYWFSRAGPAATLRIYYECYNGTDHDEVVDVPGAPMGVSYFPRELVRPPSRRVQLPPLRRVVGLTSTRVVRGQLGARGGRPCRV